MPEDREKKRIEDIANRLHSFGVLYNSLKDEWLVNFISEKVMNEIKSECNVSCIPHELYEKMIDVICGEFLSEKRSRGDLELKNIGTMKKVSSIKLGDTQVDFSNEDLNDDERLDCLIDGLKSSILKSDYVSFRKMRW